MGCPQVGQTGTSFLVGDRWIERSRLASTLGWSVGGTAERGTGRGGSPLSEDSAVIQFLEDLAKDPLVPQ